MKKYFFLFVLSLLFVGCSSDGSREIQIDEVKFSSYDEKFKNVYSVLEVVPGKYELAWTRTINAPQLQNYSISLKLKLRLKRTVKVKPEVMDKVANAKDLFSPISNPFIFFLIDANGKKEDFGVQRFDLTTSFIDKWVFNKDQTMDFLRFLQSKPGTEIELVIKTLGMISNVNNCIEICKGAKGIVCDVPYPDRFERDFGTIE